MLGNEIASLVAHSASGASMFGKAAKIKTAIRKSGCAYAATAAVGDEVRDVEAAQDAGIASLAVTWGYASAKALETARPTQLVHRPEDIVEWFVR